MDKKAERLRGLPPRDDESVHIFNLYIDNELFTNFRAQCILEKMTVREKIIALVESSLG